MRKNQEEIDQIDLRELEILIEDPKQMGSKL